MVPKTRKSSAQNEGRFDKRDFICTAEDDEFEVPAGERAIARFEAVEQGLELTKYWPSKCPHCYIREKSTPPKYRRITRWKKEPILGEMEQQLDAKWEAFRIRSRTLEHPFGIIKSLSGAIHFLTKTMKNVATEMSLHIRA